MYRDLTGDNKKEEYESLLRTIYEAPLEKKPKLGSRPTWLKEENRNIHFEKRDNNRKNKKTREVLWVDDRPENNVYERKRLEKYGMTFSLALSTQQALNELQHKKYDMIISDMGRKEGPYEGYVLLKELRKNDSVTPFIIYASGGNMKKHVKQALESGAQGSTNNPDELILLVKEYLT